MATNKAKYFTFSVLLLLFPLPIFEFINLKVTTGVMSFYIYLFILDTLNSVTNFTIWLILWATQIFAIIYFEFGISTLATTYAVHRGKSAITGAAIICFVAVFLSFLPIYGDTGNSGKPVFTNCYVQYIELIKAAFNKSLKDAP